MDTRAWIVAVDMGYGHQRTAYPLRHLALDGEVINANHYDGIPENDKIVWERARKVYAYCTHGIFSGNAKGNVSKNLDLMIVSNSIYQPEHEKIEVIPLEDFFAEAIYRTNEGKSLSELFE